jgi:hypothetical protein
MSHLRNDGAPQEPYHRARTKGRIIAVLAMLLLALGVYVMVPERGEMRTAENTPGTTSGVNNPQPAPPREGEPQ